MTSDNEVVREGQSLCVRCMCLVFRTTVELWIAEVSEGCQAISTKKRPNRNLLASYAVEGW